MNVRAKRRRVVITLDSADVDVGQLEPVSRLAAGLDAELEAVFVEDTDVLQLAGLPFVREYRFASMRMEGMKLERLEEELRAAAKRAERTLAAHAALRSVPWRFRVWRGSLEHELLQALQADVLALCAPRIARRPAAAAGRPGRMPAVAAWFDNGPGARRALDTAARLAAAAGASLALMAPAQASDAAQSARETLREETEPAPPALAVHTLEDTGPQALTDALRGTGSTVLVVARESPLLATRPLRDWLHRSGCALLLVA